MALAKYGGIEIAVRKAADWLTCRRTSIRAWCRQRRCESNTADRH